MEDRLSLIALSRSSNLSRRRKYEIYTQYTDTLPNISDIRPSGGLWWDVPQDFPSRDALEKEIETLKKRSVRIVTIDDDDYPPSLRPLPDPPLVLYVRGELPLNGPAIAIVGSRKATYEGLSLAEKISETLSFAGITVVSGMARGIDTAAHKGAVREKGRTIAVLGCGIDICYPSENRRLFEQIQAEGAIVTEYPPGDPPLPYHFPERNRIIAGLSRGILVVEATEKSGSLITARLGAEYGREVMAVPGNVYSDSFRGTNRLIKEGAKLIDNAGEIITTCFPSFTVVTDRKADSLDGEEQALYDAMGGETIHVDRIIDTTGLEAKHVMVLLTRLEMKGRVGRFPGGLFVKK